jgi:putative transposase
MRIDHDKRHRRSIRLKDYDYTQPGAYFVTMVTRGRECLFGEVVDGAMGLNDAGEIVQAAWDDLPNHYGCVVCDAFVVMPNHVHGIVVLNDIAVAGPTVGAGFKPGPTQSHANHSLAEIVRAFKTFSARRVNARQNTHSVSVWQRNYYDHIIRNEESLNRIRQYILDNPARWEFDRENPSATAPEPENAWRMA